MFYRERKEIHLKWTTLNLKWSNLTLMWAHLPTSWALGWPWPMWPLTLTQVTFDLDSWSWTKTKLPLRLQNQAKNHDLWSYDLDLWPMILILEVDLGGIYLNNLTKFHDSRCNTFRDMNYCPVNFCLVILSQTDRQTDRQKAMHMSPPCMSTGGLKNQTSFQFF